MNRLDFQNMAMNKIGHHAASRIVNT
jgi:hypothetical protein